MRKLKLLVAMLVFLATIFTINFNINAQKYLSDKTEIVVGLDVAGAEALCQTDDGFVWIGQYSGLTRYNSKDTTVFKGFEENGIVYDVINVKDLEQKDNVLYILTDKNLFKYENNQFSFMLSTQNLKDKYNNLLDNDSNEIFQSFDLATNNILYLSSSIGLFYYDLNNNNIGCIEESLNKKVDGSVIYPKNNKLYYYVFKEGPHVDNELIFYDNTILTMCLFEDSILFGTTTSIIEYNIETNEVNYNKFDMIDDQVNKILYSKKDSLLFVATEEKGLYIIDTNTYQYSLADNLKNKTQLIDIMVDYENNLWVASHNASSSGVSIITKNALVNLLYEDAIWNNVSNPQINSITKHNNILYLASKSGLFYYDLNEGKIINDYNNTNIIMNGLNQYLLNNGLPQDKHDFRDVTIFNNKLYCAVYSVGLLEYDFDTKNVVVYGNDFVNDNSNILKINGIPLNDPVSILNVRSLRAFDNFIIAGYQTGGVFKFENNKITIFNTDRNAVYINKSIDGKIIVDQTNELFYLSDDLETKTTIQTETNVTGNRLKFLVDGNKIYYTLNSRLFCYLEDNGNIVNYEINIPLIQGSIVELSKVKVDNGYKYVVASTSQIYIIDDLETNIDASNTIINYDVYDSTNGLQTIAANTSGYYDEESKVYYFQTTKGVYAYDFKNTPDGILPLKIAMNYIDVDGVKTYGDNITIDKNTTRLAFDLSVLGFRPNKGYSLYYKFEGIDNDYILLPDGVNNISYTNLSGGTYKFRSYVLDEFGQISNEIEITIIKPKHIYEEVWFWVTIVILALIVIAGINILIIYLRTKSVKKREAELKATTINAIETTAKIIDARDAYTNGHSSRVGYYSWLIAKELGIKGDELDNIYYIALLHDVGKIGVRDHILNKPGRLTDEEFVIMKSHAAIGGEILKDISTIPNIEEGARYHHERWDGNGYPEGKKGEDIPYIARIICCADCYDAMATKRVYKEPYTIDKIISEFERCAGTQFDPSIAPVVIKLIKEGKLTPNIDLKEIENLMKL